MKLGETAEPVKSAWEKALDDLVTDAKDLDDRAGRYLQQRKPGSSVEIEEEEAFWESQRREAKRIKDTLESYQTAQPRSDEQIDNNIRYIKNKADIYLTGRVRRDEKTGEIVPA